MNAAKLIMITLIIILSLSVGYFKDRKRYAAIGVLGLVIAFYAAVFLNK